MCSRHSPIALTACEGQLYVSDLRQTQSVIFGVFGSLKGAGLQVQGFGSALSLPLCTATMGSSDVERQLLARL